MRKYLILLMLPLLTVSLPNTLEGQDTLRCFTLPQSRQLISDAIKKEKLEDYTDSLELMNTLLAIQNNICDSLLENEKEQKMLVQSNNLDLMSINEGYEEENDHLYGKINKLEKKIKWYERIGIGSAVVFVVTIIVVAL